MAWGCVHKAPTLVEPTGFGLYWYAYGSTGCTHYVCFPVRRPRTWGREGEREEQRHSVPASSHGRGGGRKCQQGSSLMLCYFVYVRPPPLPHVDRGQAR